MNRGTKVFKNTLYLTISQIANKILLFFFTVAVARYMQESGFGRYSLVVTIVGFFTLFTNYGLGPIAFRDVSKNHSAAVKYFNNILLLRVLLGFLSFLLLYITVRVLGYPYRIVLASCVFGITIFTTNIVDSVTSVLNAFEKMGQTAVISVSLNLFTLILGIIALRRGHGLLALVLASAVAGVMTLLMSFVFARRTVRFDIAAIDAAFCKVLIKNSTPLMFLGFLAMVYSRIDIVVLSKFTTDSDVGLYNAAYKLMETFMIVSNSIVLATFPNLSRHFHSSVENMKKLYVKILRVLAAAGTFFAILVFFFAARAVPAIMGTSYEGSVAVLKIVIWAVPLMYINMAMLYTLLAADLQSMGIWVVASAAFLNLGLNYIFIPRYGYIAPAVITIICELFVMAGYSTLIRKKIFPPTETLKTAG